MKRIAIALLSMTAVAQEPPQHTRTHALAAEQHLGEVELDSGAVSAEIEAAPVDYTVPAVLNGVPLEGLADVHLEVQLRYTAAGVLGSRAAGEFVPHQKVHVTIVNTTTSSEETTSEFDLLPHVGRDEGWHYASNVLLPPGDSEDDPFSDTYHVTVAIEPAIVVATHADASPPSGLFLREAPLVIFDADVVFGGISVMPVGDVTEQLDRVQAYLDIRTALDASDFATVVSLFDTGLKGMVESRMNLEGYDTVRGITDAQLADLLTNVSAAIDQTGPTPDCFFEGEVVTSECKEWIKKGIERAFYLSMLHEIDEALEAIEAGAFDAVEGAAHKWDEAWAYFQALKPTVASRQANCDSGRFGTEIVCDMDAAMEQAALDGTNALLTEGGAGFEDARAEFERKLLQIETLSLVHEIIAMREKVVAVDDAGFNKARTEARAFYRTISYLFSSRDDATFTAALEDRDSASFLQDEAVALVELVNETMSDLLASDEQVATEVIP